MAGAGAVGGHGKAVTAAHHRGRHKGPAGVEAAVGRAATVAVPAVIRRASARRLGSARAPGAGGAVRGLAVGGGGGEPGRMWVERRGDRGGGVLLLLLFAGGGAT